MIVVLVSLVVPAAFAQDISLEDPFVKFTNAMSLAPHNFSKASMFSVYCSNIVSPTSEGGGLVLSWAESFFRSDQSLFVYVLCRSWDAKFPVEDSPGELLKPDLFKALSLGQFGGGVDLCAAHREECDLSRYTSRVFSALMSDIFRIKRANFLGVRSSKLIGKKERIDALFAAYFAMEGSTLPDFQLTFPKTTSMVDSNQQFFVKSLQRLKVLDLEKLLDLSCAGAPDLISCGLYASGDGVDQHFLDFVYNEYLNYAIFVDFATNYTDKKAAAARDETTFLSLYTESASLSQQRKIYRQALQYALDDFKDFVSTYPLHVGLVLYQEKLLQFRDKFSKVLPPLYTLYEKLRNVQPVK